MHIQPFLPNRPNYRFELCTTARQAKFSSIIKHIQPIPDTGSPVMTVTIILPRMSLPCAPVATVIISRSRRDSSRNHALNVTTRTKSKARKSQKGAMPFTFSASTATKTPVRAPKTVIHVMCCKGHDGADHIIPPPCDVCCDQTMKGEI